MTDREPPRRPSEIRVRFTEVTDGHSRWRCRYGQALCLERCFCGERAPHIDPNGDVSRERGQIVWGPACGKPVVHTEDGYPMAFCAHHAAKRAQRRHEETQRRALEQAASGNGGAPRRGFR